ncbi:MAG: PspC domain-containing protein [Chloroflexi bacterium]|nr:PspC domain-containing protein [Chloroflexota bacterium]
MNGNGRLYRSTSEAMLGGVAAGLGNYLKIDPTFIRLTFVLLTIFSGGAFFLAYLALWLIVPTAGSTASDASQIIHENLSDIGARVRGFPGGNPGAANNPPAGSQPAGNPTGPSAPNASYNAGQAPQAGSMSRSGPGIGPVVLISIGVFFLLGNVGFFRIMQWHAMWPLLFIGLGAFMLARRR